LLVARPAAVGAVALGAAASLPSASMNRRFQQAVVTVLTVGAILLGTATRAEAYTTWAFTDDFETTASQWYRYGEGLGDCPVYHDCSPAAVRDNADHALSGTHYARISNTSGYGDSWVSLGRNVRLPAGAEQCSVRVFIRVDYSTLTPATISVEVIRSDTWTYEMLKTYQRTNLSFYSSAYRLYAPDSWTPTSRDVAIRIVAVGQEFGVLRIHVDNVDIRCRVA
jgi:hypothetical protein